MSIEQYLQAAPKAELHVHLEGAIRPETLMELAKRNNVALPAQTVEELREWFRFRDFPHFVEIFFTCSRCIQKAKDYELIAYEFGESMARQGIRYAEATFSACTHAFSKGIPFDVYFTGLTKGRERAQRDFGVEINWIFDIVRDSFEEPGKRADYTVQVAREGMQDGVVALGLGGYEVGYPPELFTRWFERGLEYGLHSIPHAGETLGSESVWGAVRELKAERIGHGVRSIEDPELVAFLAEKQIPLEICPTSNICLGVYPDYQQHPLLRLLAAGIPITINSDDPPLFNTDQAHEVELLHSAFGLGIATINQILLNGVRYSCLMEDRKKVLEQEFQKKLQVLANQYL